MAKDAKGHGSERRAVMGEELRATKALQAKSAYPTRHNARIAQLKASIREYDQRERSVRARNKPRDT